SLCDEPRRVREQMPLFGVVDPVHGLVADRGADDASEDHRELSCLAERPHRRAPGTQIQAHAHENAGPFECRMDESKLRGGHGPGEPGGLRRALRIIARTSRKNSPPRARPPKDRNSTNPVSLPTPPKLIARPHSPQTPNPTMPMRPMIRPSTLATFQPPSEPGSFTVRPPLDSCS